MYLNTSFNSIVTPRRCSTDTNSRLTQSAGKIIIQWSPPNGGYYLTRNRYASPKSVSKSVPRRKKGMVCHNIHRSLSFDMGTRSRAKQLLNSSSKSNTSLDKEHYLSRSAKILRALNINYSPMSSRFCAISKSLNFSPSPNSKELGLIFPDKNQRNVSIKNVNSSKVHKTLNFDETDSSESIANSSKFETSIESIDENQNQTPSQRSGRAKKSLNYLSPKFEFAGYETSIQSPKLRSDLRLKIDDLVQSSPIENPESSKRSLGEREPEDLGACVSRNLFNDFHDDGDDEHEDDVIQGDNYRAETPQNFIKIVPESSSAIKKSHKKERVLGRMERAKAHFRAIKDRSSFGNLSRLQADSIQDLTESGSMIQSYVNETDDNVSETGSIFDYTNETDSLHEKTGEAEELQADKQEKDSLLADCVEKNDRPEMYDDKMNQLSDETYSKTSKASGSDDLAKKIVEGKVTDESKTEDAESREIVKKTPEKGVRIISSVIVTPENRLNKILHGKAIDSIKKSHKKLKDSHKKLMMKPRILQESANNENNCSINSNAEKDGDRAATPENMNSSRLLLSQFSSVKKSHKKGKHRKILSAQRIEFSDADRETPTTGDCDCLNSSVSSSTEDVSHFCVASSSSRDPVKAGNTQFANCDANYQNFQKFLDSDDNSSMDSLSNSLCRSTPIKRKSKFAELETNAICRSPSNRQITAGTFLAGEQDEEFKIFTPIKKIKSFESPTPQMTDNIGSMGDFDSRCSTPPTGRSRSFMTISDNSGKNVGSSLEFIVPSIREPTNDADNSKNGRLTPQNQSTAFLMAGLNSIKKSHKKDKRGNVSRRSLICAQDTRDIGDGKTEDKLESSNEENVEESWRSRDESMELSMENSKSVDCGTGEKNSGKPMTPPNCLKAITYLKLQQTTSIKRSHKKVRDRKKFRLIDDDNDLSDDGSIFDETEKSLANESSMEPQELGKIEFN